MNNPNLSDRQVKAVLNKKDLDPAKAFILLQRLGMGPGFIALLAANHLEPTGILRKQENPQRMKILARIASEEADEIEKAYIAGVIELDDELLEEIENTYLEEEGTL